MSSPKPQRRNGVRLGKTLARKCPHSIARGPVTKTSDGNETTSKANSENTSVYHGIDRNEYRMVLVGNEGVGKSSTGNTILGQKVFKAKTSVKPVTQKCHFYRTERFGKKILLVDTPTFFDTSTPRDVIEHEVKNCIGLSAPGPHAFLLVMSVANSFTKEDIKVFNEISTLFGDDVINHLIVVLTGRDQFDEGSSIEYLIKEYPEEFRNLIGKARGGYITFNNRGSDSEKEEDVKKLLDRIDEMVKKHGGSHFISETFDEVEMIIQQRVANEVAAKKEEIRKAVEDELRPQIMEELRANVEKKLMEQIEESNVLIQELKKKVGEAKANGSRIETRI